MFGKKPQRPVTKRITTKPSGPPPGAPAEPPRPAPAAALPSLKGTLVFLGARADRAAEYAPAIEQAFLRYGIVTPLRIGHALAQLMHESGRLRYTEEVWGPTAAQRRYEGRLDLGNTQPGDGYRFRGRGLVQLTGRANYRNYTEYRRRVFGDDVDFLANPDLVARTPHAADVFGWFWTVEKGLNPLADQGDHAAQVRAITRRINGGYNGLDDRLALFRTAMLHVRRLPGYTNDRATLAR